MRESNPIELAGSVTKSRIYFRHARWKGRRRCPRCGYRLLYHLKDKHVIGDPEEPYDRRINSTPQNLAPYREGIANPVYSSKYNDN